MASGAAAAAPLDGPILTRSQRNRRDAIVSTTVDLLASQEHGQIHMRDIADRSGVALATLYRYFASKELLFAHAVVAWGETFVSRTRQRAGNAASDAERMQQTFRRTIKAYERWPNFYRLIAALEITDDAEARQVFQVFSANYQESLRTVLEHTDPEDAAVVAQVLLATLGTALRKWSVGEWETAQVYDHMSRAVDLLFREPRSIVPHAAVADNGER
jgi:TetR/AcrR family transcriptional regulator, cholesterol catabolism regulator